MTHYYLFSDASFDPHSRKGVGATLILNDINWNRSKLIEVDEIRTIRMDGENIARLEFISAIDVLSQWKEKFKNQGSKELTLVIDCKAIENLLGRRERLENNKFISNAKGQVLANADLYKVFLKLYDELTPKIQWVKGHSKEANQSDIEKVFSQIDKLARKRLRELL